MSKLKDLKLTQDEITVLASGLMEVTILDKKRTIVGDGFNFWVKIKARVQIEKMEEMAKRVKEKSVVEDYKKIQEAYDKGQKEIEELKKQLAGAKGEKEKKRVETKITDDERLFQAKEWYDKGYQHSLNKEYDKAIEAYTSAIALDPNLAKSYVHRGGAYYEKGQYDRADEDINKAVSLDPNLAYAYGARGIIYYNKGQYDRAIEDFNKAITLNPNDVDAYTLRGAAYYNKGNMGRAISDFQKACDMGLEVGCEELQKALKER